jgi:DNA modification methylase
VITLLRGNALALPLEDASVDLIVTSPPYFGLRSYTDGGEHYAGQLGSEPTPAEFLDALIAATAEMVRVLKPSGSIWVNLGDKYAGSGGGEGSSDGATGRGSRPPRRNVGIPTKSLVGIPWRYALRCIDDLGLILRAEVIWSKPNGLPESVTDRVRRSHEQWFHFTVRPRYYAAVDEVREPVTGGSHVARLDKGMSPRNQRILDAGEHGKRQSNTDPSMFDPRGKLPGSVWTIPTQPLTVPPELGVDHFAAFPMEWPRRIIKGWSPPGICTGCGEGRRPVVEKSLRLDHMQNRYSRGFVDGIEPDGNHRGMNAPYRANGSTEATITGYACACPDTTAPTTPAVILDSFGGTGTTALVAHALGRHGISVDMSADYCRLAAWRCSDPGQLSAAMQVDKPEPVAVDQLHLFEGAL